MASMELYIGLPASGKTTAALEWVAQDPFYRRRLNYDDLRLQMFGSRWKWNKRDEGRMQDEAKRLVQEWLSQDLDVVIDNTNLTQGSRDRWRAVALKYGATYYEQDFALPVWECVERDWKRKEGRVGRAVIERMALVNGIIDFNDPEVYDPQIPFVLVDMDGTLADCSARQIHLEGEKKDWNSFFKNCLLDPPNADIVALTEMLSTSYYIIVVSGRPIDQCGIETEDWLYKHLSCDVTHLFMRNGGDNRSDVEVKRDILALLPKERIRFVLDDRDSVVAMWRSQGLRCLQVAPGNF